jgi:hypothetical protein
LLVDWHRASSSSLAVTIELQGQHLAWERELDSRESAIVMWEEGLAAFAHTFGRCTWNVILVALVPMPFSETSSPRRAPLVPDLNNSLTMAEC